MINTPILEFENQEQAEKCLKEWQTRLFLDDWIIKINLVDKCEIDDEIQQGKNSYITSLQTSIIEISKLNDDMKNRIMKCCHEATLVHELLHLKLLFSDNVNNTNEGNFFGMHEHILIEQMAKSLIMAKYNLTFDWFKN